MKDTRADFLSPVPSLNNARGVEDGFLFSLPAVKSISSSSDMDEELPIMLNAIFDEASGEILLAHPTKPDVFVDPSHYRELRQAQAKSMTDAKRMGVLETPETNCVYTQRQVCVNGRWVLPGVWLCDRVNIQTCNCR